MLAKPVTLCIPGDVFFTKDTPLFYEGHFERPRYSFTSPYLQRFYFHEGHPERCNPLFVSLFFSLYLRNKNKPK